MSKAQNVQTSLIGKKARYARSWFGEELPAGSGGPLVKHWDEWGELAAVVSNQNTGTIFHIKWPDGSLSIELTSRMIEFEPEHSSSENADDGSDVIKCPKCSNLFLNLLDEVTSIREVKDIEGDGTLIIGRFTRYSDGGDKERLECSICHHEFPIPKDAPVKYL